MQTTLFSPPCCEGLTPSESLTAADHDIPQIGDMNATSPLDALLIVDASYNADQTAVEKRTMNPNIPPPNLNAQPSLCDTMVALSPHESLAVNSSQHKDSIYAMDQGLPDAYTLVDAPAPQCDTSQTKISVQTDGEFHVDSQAPSSSPQPNLSTHVSLGKNMSPFDLEPRVLQSSDPLSSSPPPNVEERALFSDYATFPDSSPIPSLDARPMFESLEPPLTLKESSQDPCSLDLSFLNSYPLSPSSSMPSSSPAKLFSSSPLPSSQSSDISHSDIRTDQQLDIGNMVSRKMHDSFALPVFPSAPLVPDLGATTVISQKDVSIAPTELENRPSSPTSLMSLPPVCSDLPKSPETNMEIDSHDILGEITADAPPIKSPSPSVNHGPLSLSLNKRTRSSGESSPTPGGKEKEDENVEAPAPKRLRKDMSAPPAPKRSTAASQKMQHKKLSTPFRSPLVKKTMGVPSGVDRLAQLPLGPNLKFLAESSQPKPCPTDSQLRGTNTPHTPTETHLTKARTKRAAKQFKSPLSAESSSAVVSSVRLTPTIQTLERKVQVLKRAVKVKRDGEEKTLEGLVKKWTEAGREIAYEVWGLVKDRGGDDSSAGDDGKKNLEDSWGWNEKSEKKGENWGWAIPDEGVDNREGKELEEEEEDKKEDTLGTMLKQLGIDPETLGWDEEEGSFVGE